MPIRLLGADVTAQIAAGEVVERPSSVVKELIENALDAGASRVEIELQGGGLSLIRITDDGDGIPESELELAVTKHATSKIEQARDLWEVRSLGFRGEALASIASVSRMTVVSRRGDVQAGTFIEVGGEGGIDLGSQGAPVGTSVFVRDLFRTVPARLSFLRSPAAEGGRCLHVMTQYALAYPEVSFRLLTEGRLGFHSPGNGEHRDVLLEAWGAAAAEGLFLIEETTVGRTRVTGYTGPPHLVRSRRDRQEFFVNRRAVGDRVLSSSLADAYREILPRGKHPMAVLFLEVPPDDVDVNVHPAKSEVRFRREGEIFSAVQRSLRATLVANDALSALDSGDPQGAAIVPEAPPDGDVVLEAPPSLAVSQQAVMVDTQDSGQTDHPGKPVTKERVLLRAIGQVGTTYIVTEGPDGMYLIDQHAAHERLVFDGLLNGDSSAERPVQALLMALTVSLTRRQESSIQELGELLHTYGFRWDPFGEGSLLLRGVPGSLREGEAVPTLVEVLDRSGGEPLGPEEDGREPDAFTLHERRIAATVACHSTVRAGQVLTLPEMDGLLRQFEAADFPRLCPHGRPTMVHLSSTQLEKQFGRR
ncbi:MAG: DNA mismatch repair endonuclease MutL [Dehalococcoidia bacterium]|nr:DNA mismatch repair endonuclease MutL [Dehalococcoidia bacterium]